MSSSIAEARVGLLRSDFPSSLGIFLPHPPPSSPRPRQPSGSDLGATSCPTCLPPSLRIGVRRGVRAPHMAAFLWGSLVSVSAVVFLNAALPLLLDTFLAIPSQDSGSVAATSVLAHESTVILSSWLWGLASDRVGRRPVFVVGMLLLALGTTLQAWSSSMIALLAFRVVFALGASAALSMLTALLADYPSEQGRGRSGGLLGLTAGLGALFALFVLLRLPLWLQDLSLAPRLAGQVPPPPCGPP